LSLNLIGPAFYPVPLAPNRDANLDLVHAQRRVKEAVVRHAARVGPLHGRQLEHGQQEIRHALAVLAREVVLLAQHVLERPVPQSVDVAQLALAVEDLGRPLARQAERLGEGAQQLDDLRNVVVVLAVLGAGLRVEEVVARDQLEDLDSLATVERVCSARTMAAMLHTSVLAPHFAPSITSGDRYCRV
jgi:hypothetical protein